MYSISFYTFISPINSAYLNKSATKLARATRSRKCAASISPTNKIIGYKIKMVAVNKTVLRHQNKKHKGKIKKDHLGDYVNHTKRQY